MFVHIHVRTYTHPHMPYIICIDGHCFAEYFNLKLLALLWTLKGSGAGASSSNNAGVLYIVMYAVSYYYTMLYMCIYTNS